MRLRNSLAIILLILLAGIPSPASAQTCSNLTWGETKTRAFAFTYQASNPLGAELAEQYGELLDETFARFSALFEITLPVPVMVRVYPTERDYYCYNALAPQIPLGQTHSHIGGREIALIAQNIQAQPNDWSNEALDAFRGELAVLFLNRLTAEHTPEGLQIGINVYAQDPFVTFEQRVDETNPPFEKPSASWRSLWELPDPIGSPSHTIEAASITAYLIDVYGWNRFLEFADALRTAESWRLALESVYPADANALEAQWAETYYPRFMSGRWRENAFYQLSLSPYEDLVHAGAYQAAADGLDNVIKLLTTLEDGARLNQAKALKATALQGLAADALARQARQAYLEGDFIASETFAADAIESYIALSDVRNLDSLLTIQAQAAEVIELHDELDGIESKLSSPFTLRSAARLHQIGSRLQELGDTAGAKRAADAITQLNSLKYNVSLAAAALGTLLAAAIFFLRLKGFKTEPPPEVQIQTRTK